MKRLPTLLFAAFVALATGRADAADATAAEYKVLPSSTLQFSTSYDGETFDGTFARFEPVLRFDPAKLADSRFEVEVDLASADTGHAERDEVLLGDEFFDAGHVATARYLATSFRALGSGRYVADGKLTLRGVEHAVPLEFSWKAGALPVLDGKATVRRLEFSVGTGDWADTALLPDAVEVTTHLVLAPRGG